MTRREKQEARIASYCKSVMATEDYHRQAIAHGREPYILDISPSVRKHKAQTYSHRIRNDGWKNFCRGLVNGLKLAPLCLVLAVVLKVVAG